jgi:hypothetical protein
LYLLRRLFRIAPMITPNLGYLGQPLDLFRGEETQ